MMFVIEPGSLSLSFYFLELHQSICTSEKWGQWLALPMQCQVIVKGPREGQFLPLPKMFAGDAN